MSKKVTYHKHRDGECKSFETEGNELELLLAFLNGEPLTREEFDRVVDFLLLNDVDKELGMDPKYIMK